MKKKFSRVWKSSKQRRKQRKYVYNAPLHILGKFMSAHLCKNLREKYKRRSLRIRKNDLVKVMRGQFKNKVGKVNRVNLKTRKVYIDNVQIVKKDGTKVFYPIHVSKLLIQELDLTDKKRLKALERNLEKGLEKKDEKTLKEAS